MQERSAVSKDPIESQKAVKAIVLPGMRQCCAMVAGSTIGLILEVWSRMHAELLVSCGQILLRGVSDVPDASDMRSHQHREETSLRGQDLPEGS